MRTLSYRLKLLVMLLLPVFFLCGFSGVNTAGLLEVVEFNNSNVYLIGDSRTYLGHEETKDTRVNWLACSGTCYDYFNAVYVPMLDSMDLTGKKIVILYGVNDVMGYGAELAAANWLNFYQTKAQEWILRGAEISVCSTLGIGPGITIDFPTLDVTAKNQEIERYNNLIKAGIPANIRFKTINVNDSRDPFKDGIHYKPAVSRKLYTTLINMVL